ncbi:16S rRNA (cytidine(1402)-2'-O)-methyltransferase [Staphylococcus warneri]|uniref:16S rRNA (cytidine(1402)-2'-O)-methyltransferase n=1 Tax=Staphylococcus warneri TaxID=1292 RepID=UPI003D766714
MTTLFLVGTPIGNLADITYRAIDTLQQVDLIACEDTRVTRKLCNHYDIKTPLKPYHEHNKDQQTDYMIEQLLSGIDIALVSDAGLPLISDPGYELVVEARQHDIKVETIPGPNAGLTALMASGLPSYTYTFLGFLPRKDKEKQNMLSERMFQSSTLIIYESPHRVTDTLKVIDKIDSQRRVSLGRELTKKFEQIVTADVNTLLTMLQNSEIPLKGEFVILIEGAEAEISTTWFDDMSIEEHVDYYIKEKNIKPKAAIKMVAEDRQSRTSEIYNIYHQVD